MELVWFSVFISLIELKIIRLYFKDLCEMLENTKLSEHFRYVAKTFMKNQCNLAVLHNSGIFFLYGDNSALQHKNDNNIDNSIKKMGFQTTLYCVF